MGNCLNSADPSSVGSEGVLRGAPLRYCRKTACSSALRLPNQRSTSASISDFVSYRSKVQTWASNRRRMRTTPQAHVDPSYVQTFFASPHPTAQSIELWLPAL